MGMVWPGGSRSIDHASKCTKCLFLPLLGYYAANCSRFFVRDTFIKSNAMASGHVVRHAWKRRRARVIVCASRMYVLIFQLVRRKPTILPIVAMETNLCLPGTLHEKPFARRIFSASSPFVTARSRNFKLSTICNFKLSATCNFKLCNHTRVPIFDSATTVYFCKPTIYAHEYC